MSDQALVGAIIQQILVALGRIERRAAQVSSARDFVSSDTGIDMLDSISMMLIAIGESCKQLDRISSGELLARYPEVDWKGAKGMRDILSHHYFDVNADIVFSVCQKQVPMLQRVFEQMLADLDQ